MPRYRWIKCCFLFALLLLHSHPLRAQTALQRPNPETPLLPRQGIDALANLVQAAELIVRGRVRSVQSFWRTDQRIIESEVAIDVTYHLLGASHRTLRVRVPGGYLAADGIGMVSLHAATFAVGDEVMVFAYQREGVWQVVGGARGNFLVQGPLVSNTDLAFTQPLAGLLPTVVTLVERRGLQAQVPTPWRYLTAAPEANQRQPLTSQSDKRKWTTPHASAAFALNLNTKQMGDDDGDRSAFHQAILAAAASWSAVAGADFTLSYVGETTVTATGYNGVNEVLFMRKGVRERAAAAQVWYTADQTIVEADIWINEDYQWNATGAPGENEVDLQSALLHEFGHWLILGHSPDADAVMFSRLSAGGLKRELQPLDERGIRAIYPR